MNELLPSDATVLTFHAELLVPIASHLETCVQLAAHLCHVPIAWLSIHNLQATPILLGVGCSLTKLQRLDQDITSGYRADLVLSISREDQASSPTLMPLPSTGEMSQLFGAAWQLTSSRGFVMGRLYVVDHIAQPIDLKSLALLERVVRQTAWVLENHLSSGESSPDAETSPSVELVWQTNHQLHSRVETLQEEHFYLSQLNYFMDTLQDYETFDQAIAQLPALLKALFPSQSGRLYLSIATADASTHSNDATNVAEVLTWGPRLGDQRQKIPMDCPVLQALHPYYTAREEPQGNCALCTFSEGLTSQGNFCVPLTGHDVHIPSIIGGVLSVSVPPAAGLSHLHRQTVIQATRHLGKVLTRLKQYDLIRIRSIRDSLTGLFNRRYLTEVLPQILRRAHHGHYSVGVIVFDIDHFKQFNDNYGHLAGDKVLQDFGVFLKGFVRGTDLACRYGGEEFVLILPEANLERVVQRAERLCQGMHYMKMEYEGRSLGTVTISAGVANFPRNGETLEALIAAADAALYQAKAEGRDRVCVA